MSDPWAYWTVDQLAAATACPVENVRQNWPRVVAQLELALIADRPVQLAAAGTIAIEAASTFLPVEEAFWLPPESRQAEYERHGYEGGPNFHGRGFIQLTHESNYRTYGRKVAELWGAGDNPTFDLVANPDNALDPDVAAAVLACYFRETGVPDAARASDWAAVRRKVYGGADPKGSARIAQIAADLGAGAATLAYNPSQPPERQVQSWVCSIRATAWVLKSLGLPVEIGPLQDEMSPRYVTPEVGLLDARGYGIAETLKAHLPAEWDDRVHVFESITWDELWSIAGQGPIALGLRGAYHWIDVARQRPDGDLDAPNPAPNYPPAGPIGDVLSRSEFDRYGPCSAVFVNATAAAPPTPVTPPAPITRADLEAEIAHLTALRDRLPAA
jgi:hypothetical protein